jgi:recombination protein RecR
VSAIDELVTELSRLPTIGRKSALRLTYHLLKQPPEQSKRLAAVLATLTERVRTCERCFNLTEAPVCSFCADPRRDAGLICVVEEASDIAAVERTAEYRGMYHVLGGRLSPLDGVGPDDLTVAELVARVAAGGVREVIVATNPKLGGDRAVCSGAARWPKCYRLADCARHAGGWRSRVRRRGDDRASDQRSPGDAVEPFFRIGRE